MWWTIQGVEENEKSGQINIDGCKDNKKRAQFIEAIIRNITKDTNIEAMRRELYLI